MLNEELIDTLVRSASDAIRNAYTPYSGIGVGACIMASDGTIYTGCTIENTIRGLSVGAGEVALYKAVSDGKREFDAIAFIGNTERPFVPNGAICQLLAEFNVQEIIMANMYGVLKTVTLDELMPYARELIGNPMQLDEEDF